MSQHTKTFSAYDLDLTREEFDQMSSAAHAVQERRKAKEQAKDADRAAESSKNAEEKKAKEYLTKKK